MKVLGVIPARFGSTRFPGKPLVKIHGKPLLQWVIEGAKTSRILSEVIVATDHNDIAELAKSLGAHVAMTDPGLATGSDRVFAAIKNRSGDIIVNIQGDEPLLEGHLLDELVEPLVQNFSIDMSTLARSADKEDLKNPNCAKIVLNQNSEAIYFSRLPIPYGRLDASDHEAICMKHIGIYAFRRPFLAAFCKQRPTPLELAEGLEQLRALYLGARIKVVKVDHISQGVDVPEDVETVEAILRKREAK